MPSLPPPRQLKVRPVGVAGPPVEAVRICAVISVATADAILDSAGNPILDNTGAAITSSAAGASALAVMSARYVWASGANGRPQLVWATTAEVPTSVEVEWLATPPAGFVGSGALITITPTNPEVADRYRIKRPDNSIAGYAPAASIAGSTVTEFFDQPPEGWSLNSYRVDAMLGATVSTPTQFTNTLDFTGPPASISATVNEAAGTATVTWTDPVWGRPITYEVWERGANGIMVGPLLTLPGTAHQATVPITAGEAVEILVEPTPKYRPDPNGFSYNSASVTVRRPPLAPVNVNMPDPATIPTFAANTLTLQWSAPAGTVHHYEVQKYDIPANPTWVALGTTTAGIMNWGTLNAGYMRVRSVASNGDVSAWVQAGPRTPKPPVPLILSYAQHFSQPGWVQLIVDAQVAGISFLAEDLQAFSGGWSTTYEFITANPVVANGSDGEVQFVVARVAGGWVQMRVRQQRAGVWSEYATTAVI